jgi:hypothetical protein
MLIFLSRKGLEPALPDVPAGVIVPQVAADVGGQEPVHPPAQVPVGVRPDGQMEMVGHKAVGQDAHGDAERGFGHHVEEGVVVLGLVKDRGAGVAPVEDVTGVATG